MNPEAMKPFGMALLDYYNGDADTALVIVTDNGNVTNLPMGIFFRAGSDITIDRIALDNCRGRVLDVGAGTGLHSLSLQDKGLCVCAIDISPEACEIMRKRGVDSVCCADIVDFVAEPFDTVLILGRGIGMVESIAGLDYFLGYVSRLVKPDGQILLNSCDVRCTDEPRHLAIHEANRRAGRYIGEIRMCFEYKDMRGPKHGWLHVDAETLASCALRAGWSSEVLVQEEDGNYLARLTRKR